LDNFPGLTHLDLQENNFRQPPDQQHSLQYNYVIQDIKFDDTDWISPPLKFHLALNRAGRKYVRDETLPVSLWPYILERVKRLCDSNKEYKNHFGESDILYELLNASSLWQRRV
jgi:hypothetical protein